MGQARTRYIVEITSADNGTYWLYDEGFKCTHNRDHADRWTNRREANYIAGAYIRECNRICDEFGMMRDEMTASVVPA